MTSYDIGLEHLKKGCGGTLEDVLRYPFCRFSHEYLRNRRSKTDIGELILGIRHMIQAFFENPGPQQNGLDPAYLIGVGYQALVGIEDLRIIEWFRRSTCPRVHLPFAQAYIFHGNYKDCAQEMGKVIILSKFDRMCFIWLDGLIRHQEVYSYATQILRHREIVEDIKKEKESNIERSTYLAPKWKNVVKKVNGIETQLRMLEYPFCMCADVRKSPEPPIALRIPMSEDYPQRIIKRERLPLAAVIPGPSAIEEPTTPRPAGSNRKRESVAFDASMMRKLCQENDDEISLESRKIARLLDMKTASMLEYEKKMEESIKFATENGFAAEAEAIRCTYSRLNNPSEKVLFDQWIERNSASTNEVREYEHALFIRHRA